MKSDMGFTTFSLHERGFTLIELLVVISILGIMAAVGLFIYTTVLNKARDTKIRADLDAIGKAYEFRYNFSTNTYGDVLPADFDSGQIPKRPDGSNYLTCTGTPSPTSCSLGTNINSFEICTILSDGISSYCRFSIQVPSGIGNAFINGPGSLTYRTKTIECVGQTNPTAPDRGNWTPLKICLEVGPSYVPTRPSGLAFVARGAFFKLCTQGDGTVSWSCGDLTCDPTLSCGGGFAFLTDLLSINDQDYQFSFPRADLRRSESCGAYVNQRYDVRVACRVPLF